ncbi:MAG TPA: sigma-70 family RNA polymerase sigma factor [Verrucomicrobiales bacterium]|nr:sigma-70 family RNA polymerase sigma factor [Verrucomicrobiales bacterium]
MNKPSSATSKAQDQTRDPGCPAEPDGEPDDASLVSRSREGDLTAFDALVTRYRRRIYSIIHQMVRNEADAWDLSQDAFIKAWNALSRFEERSSFYTWLYRIAHNVTYDWLRRNRIRPEAEFDDSLQTTADPAAATVPSAPQGPDESLAQSETGQRIREAIAQLSPAHRETILLKEVEGCQYKEIAERMDCSIGTVMSRLFYARKKLQSLLGDLYGQS